ncbi:MULTISPECIES: hypothetical protein [unclassified Microbacterium]|uniref:hypothetical protein n=1 Tax=unclassified Microbacterium TaxID=2609290 RepID=UPI0025EF6668|nr:MULTISPECIES: hypothetical protein [unclassified Microbacterium]
MRAIVRDQAEAVPDIHALRDRLERMQGRRMDAPVLPTHPAFTSLLPGGGLRSGSAYAIARSMSLLLALMARPSQDGAWCGVVGMPELGAEAAEKYGLDLDRLVFIPDPGPRWLAVTATIAEVLPVVAVRPPVGANTARAGAEATRLAARLRDRGTVLLVQGPWPQAEAVIDVADPRWAGLGQGHGYLAGRELTVSVSSKRTPTARRARMLLPAADGSIELLGAPAERLVPRERTEYRPQRVAG